MSVEYQIDAGRQVVFTRCFGTITITDLWDTVQHLRNDPAFNPDLRQLIDLSELTGMNATFEEIWHFARDKDGDPFSGSSRRAVVAPQNFAYGLARMYEASREDRDDGGFRVFRNMAEAREWLGLDVAAASA